MKERCGSAILILIHVLVYGVFAWAIIPVPLSGLVLAVLLVAISVVDIQRFEIPDLFSALLVITGGVVLWRLELDWASHVAAAIILPMLLYAVGVAYLRYRGQPGLGFGDVKLAVGLGLWIGFNGSVWMLLAASLSAISTLLVVSAFGRFATRDLKTSGVAFAPFLCLSAWVIWLLENTA